MNKDRNSPNRLYGDYYCEVCESHMNSEGVWQSHITGKRHIKNIKKGGSDSKYEDLNVESSIKHEARKLKDTIVGLSYIQEVRRKEPGNTTLYKCFLCQAIFPSVPMVIEHAITLTHRQNYMKESSPDDYEHLKAINLKDREKEPLAVEMARKQERKYGRGSVKVKHERNKQLSLPPPKRTFDSDDDDDDMPRKIKKFDKKNHKVSKAVDCRKKANLKGIRDCREIIEERRKHAYSSDEEADMYKQNYCTKRPSHDSKRSFDDKRPDSYKSLTPSSRKSSKREVNYSRTHIQASPKEHCSQSRSYHTREKDLNRKEKEYPLPSETEVQQPLSNSQVLTDCVHIANALPTQIFLNLFLMKLDNIKVDDLELLSEVINKAQAVLCSKFLPNVHAVLKERMSQKSENSIQNPSSYVVAPGSAISSLNCLIKHILNRSQGNDDSIPSDSQNVTLHQASQLNCTSYPGSFYENTDSSFQRCNITASDDNYSYNSVVAASSSCGIPGLTLTDESRDTQSCSP